MGLDPKSATAATASLAPGFRFHPTDEELVRYYLKRKVCQKPFRFDAISEIDIYKSEPWDLPGKSKLKSRDLEWYFFSILDKKYGNGSKTNRATEKGYWKTTGKDRPVLHRSRTVGMKKTLVYHSGRAPKGARSNWVMHEYRLVDEDLGKAGIYQDAFVLCRVFQKSGTGPKNGEQYGAPFVEEEWDDDDLVMVPGEVAAEEVVVGEDAYLDGDDLEQILDTEIHSEDVPLPVSFYYGDSGINSELPEDLFDDPQKPLVDMGGSCIAPGELEGQKLFHLQNDTDMKIVKHEYIGEPSNSEDLADVDYLLDEPFLDAMGNPPFDSGQFLETNDLSNPIEEDRSGFDMVEDYLTFFDADENNIDCVGFDASRIMESENLWSDQLSLTEQDVIGGAPHENVESEHVLQGQSEDVASTSKQEPSYLKSDIQHPFLKQASCMLGNIPAPPAFASEFPSKGAALGLNSGSHSSSSIHVTAGMIRIRNTTLTADATYWSPGKNVDINIILSFGPSQDDDDGGGGMLFGKSASTMSWSWFYLVIFLWVMILPLSFKIGTCFYTGKAS